MKNIMPWLCLGATAAAQAVQSNLGIEAYREGRYLQAAQALSSDKVVHDSIVDYYIARMRLYGYGQLKNNLIALRYFQQAAEKGYLPAQRILGSYNLLVDKNPTQALVWFKKAADANNDLGAQMYCAAAYLFGVGVKKNVDLAKRYYIAAAKNGDPIAQYTLGVQFIESRHDSNKKLGLIWLTKALEKNSPEAQLKFGEFYANGQNVAKDLEQAKALINQSIAQGYVPALYGMGEFYLKQNDVVNAQQWFNKAIEAGYAPANLALANLYLKPNTPLLDEKKGFLLMLKAAQQGMAEAMLNLSQLYKTGRGVTVNDSLAEEWLKKAKVAANETPLEAQIKAARWLTHGKMTTLADCGYQLHGIFSDWQNPEALRQNIYNQPPQMEVVTRDSLFKPQFVLLDPNTIPISELYSVIASTLTNNEKNVVFPYYTLDEKPLKTKEQSAAQPTGSSLVQVNPKENHALHNNDPRYLERRAMVGDPDAQFRLGLMYWQGIGVKKDISSAMHYFTLAAEQQELCSQYMLALLLLQATDNPDYQKGLALLRDAAFKGNDYAQYALAHLYENGVQNAKGEWVLKPDESQAMDMYYIAAANQYGPAQYRLAELLVRQKNASMAVNEQQKQRDVIKKLYEGAYESGVAQAALPLAYFYAMDNDKTKQAQAFEVAKKQSGEGNGAAALLLGLMFDRGIATPASHSDAVYWYQQSPANPVSSFLIGYSMSQGQGLSRDSERAEALLKEAANAGFSYANLNLAILKQQRGEVFLPELMKALEQGNSHAGLLLADYYLALANNNEQMQQARAIYQRFADQGNRDAELKLGYMYDQGLGLSADPVMAQNWYSKAAEQGQPVAQYLLAQLYQLGKLANLPDYQEAKKWYSRAQFNFSPAAVALGFVYDTVDDDYQNAQGAYQIAANKQDAIAAFNLGLIYEQGKGRAVDYKKAKELYQQASAHGVSQAMVQLAGLYFNGLVGSRDVDEALTWYKKAAALGDAEALYQLGLLSETGVGTKLDYVSAQRYYEQSAKKGNDVAKLALARMYQYGLGVTKDTAQAEKLYQELASVGNAFAQYQLATCYYEGAEGNRLTEKSKQLLMQAQDNGNVQARRMLQRLAAETKDRVSFIEPLPNNNPLLLVGQPVDLMYLNAINEWNRGDENASRTILDKIIVQFPHYAPAKQAYEQINQRQRPEISG